MTSTLSRLLRVSIVLLCVTGVGCVREARAQPYKPEPGPYEARSVELDLPRPEGAAALPIRVRFPVGAPGERPVVVFSHGMGGSSDSFGELTNHLATHGYVVILPTHADSVRLQRASDPDAAREIFRDPMAYTRRVRPLDRVADVRLIADELAQIERRLSPDAEAPEVRLSRVRLAIAGHSAGAMTAQITIGASIRTGFRAPREEGDKRFVAAVVISGQGTTSRMFTEQSWKEISEPMLVIAGSEDVSPASRETPQSRRHPFEFASPGDKYLLWIEGATHGSYQGKAATRLLGERPTGDIGMITTATNSATLAFLDAFVGPEESRETARAYLSGPGISNASGSKAVITAK